jgi:hypothetical protein
VVDDDADEDEDDEDDEEEVWEPVPGRLMDGELRKQPLVRIGAGVAIGLLVGFLAAFPMKRRAENKAAFLHDEAVKEYARGHSEAQARGRALDEQADDARSAGATKLVIAWLVIGAGAFGVWYRIT